MSVVCRTSTARDYFSFQPISQYEKSCWAFMKLMVLRQKVTLR